MVSFSGVHALRSLRESEQRKDLNVIKRRKLHPGTAGGATDGVTFAWRFNYPRGIPRRRRPQRHLSVAGQSGNRIWDEEMVDADGDTEEGSWLNKDEGTMIVSLVVRISDGRQWFDYYDLIRGRRRGAGCEGGWLRAACWLCGRFFYWPRSYGKPGWDNSRYKVLLLLLLLLLLRMNKGIE